MKLSSIAVLVVGLSVSTPAWTCPWVVIRGGTAARRQFDRITREAGFEPRIRFETESYDVAQALVATGYGVALVSRMALRRDAGLTHRPLRHRNAHRTILSPGPARHPNGTRSRAGLAHWWP